MFKIQGGDPTQNSTIKTLSYDEVLAKLESLKREQRAFANGQRAALYRFLQQAAELALLVEADEDIQSRFREKTGEKDVMRAALIFIFEAKSESERKEASKRAQALRYLIDKLDVAVEDIATAIPKNGGVERLASLAAKSRQDEADEDQEDQDGDNRHEDAPEEADENVEAERKFGKQIRVGFSPKLTKKLSRFADKTRIKIIGYIRASSDGPPTIEVKKSSN
jgi:hypothetical protein